MLANIIYIIGASDDESRRVAAVVAREADDVRLFESGEAFLRAVTPDACGCVLAPSELAGSGMCALIKGIQAHGLKLPVVVLGHGDDLTTAVALMRAGAAEYVELPVPDRHLRRAVRQALASSRGCQVPPRGREGSSRQ
jgi:two-component system response regulator FixJ